MNRFNSPLARRAAVTWLTLLSSLAFLFVARTIVARLLGPAAVGMYVLMLTAAMLGGTVLSLGLPAYNASFAVERSPRALLANCLAWNGAVFAILSCVCGPVLLGSGLSASQRFMIVGVWMAPCAAMLECTRGVLQGSGAMSAYNWVGFVGGALNMVATVLLSVTIGLTLGGAALCWIASIVVSLGLGVIFIAGGRRLPRPDLGQLLESLKFGGQAWLSQLAGVVNIRIALVLIEVLLGTSAVGVYAIAATIAEGLFYLPNAVAAVVVARFASASREEAARLLVRSSALVLLINTCVAVGLALVARPLILRVFGDQYEESVTVLRFLLPGVVIYTPFAVTTWYANAHLRKPSMNLFVGSFSAVTGSALIVALAPGYGLAGVALACTCAYAAASVVNVVFLQRSSHLSYARFLEVARGLPGPPVQALGRE